MTMRLLGLGLGSLLTLVGVAVPTVSASADTTCYTGCTAPTPTAHDPFTTAKVQTAPAGSLAFTGADIEEMTVIGGGALLVGGVLALRGRRRGRTTA